MINSYSFINRIGLLVVLMVCLLAPLASFAQLNYAFTTRNTPFVPLGATATTHRTGGNVDDAPSINGIPMPFLFNFNGNLHDTVSLNNNGAVYFGLTAPTIFQAWVASNPTTEFVVALGCDLTSGASGTMKTDILGTAPNRTFVIEYLNYTRLDGSGSVNFQVQLYETSNRIEIHYGLGNNGGTSTGVDATVGLRSVGVANFSTRTSTGTGAGAWSNSNAALVGTNIMPFTGATAPADGLKYIWTPFPTGIANDLNLTGFQNLPTSTVICDSTSIYPNIVVQNRGTNSVFPVLRLVVKQGANIVADQTITGSTIAVGASDTLRANAPILLPSLATYTIQAYSFTPDDFAANDTINSSVTPNRVCNQMNYGFNQTEQTFTPLVGGTRILALPTSNGGLVTIPFSIPFAGQRFSQISVHRKGYILFGNRNVTTTPPTAPMGVAGTTLNLGAFIFGNHQTATSTNNIRWAVSGVTLPNEYYW